MCRATSHMEVELIWEMGFTLFVSHLYLKLIHGDTSEIGLGYSFFEQPISFQFNLNNMQFNHLMEFTKWPHIKNVLGLIER